MKTLRLIVVGIILFITSAMQAQFSLSFTFGTPPPWGPAGYSTVRYYYLPDVEAYYDVRASTFIYFSGSAWVRNTSLPGRYRNYDLYRGYKVVMPDYHGIAPYGHFKEHKMKYGKGYHGKPQRTNGVRPGGGNPGPDRSPKHPNDHPGGSHDKGNNSNHGNDKGNSHGNDKNHGNGNGKHK